MAAPTLEKMLDRELQMIEASVMLLRKGLDRNVTGRLEFIHACLDDAIETQQRIEKRERRKVRA